MKITGFCCTIGKIKNKIKNIDKPSSHYVISSMSAAKYRKANTYGTALNNSQIHYNFMLHFPSLKLHISYQIDFQITIWKMNAYKQAGEFSSFIGLN
jgi:hypothetical protein